MQHGREVITIHPSIIHCPLFAGIEEDQLNLLLGCLSAQTHKYRKDDYVLRAGEPAKHVGIVLSGFVNIVHENFWGDRTILTHVEPGGLFAEAFSSAEIKSLPVSVVADENSEIMLIDYRRIVTVCSSACVFHSRLIHNMLNILANKNIALTQKIEHLSQRTTREKLLSLLSSEAAQTKSNEVTLPYNRQGLADFLCVERSALSRELAAMKKEGLLDYDKNRFVLR